MPIANSIQSLQIYDILANIVPGSILLLTVAAIFRIEVFFGRIEPSLVAGIFLVIAFVIGHAVQFVASELNGTPRLFGYIISDIRGLPPIDSSERVTWLPSRVRSWLGFRKSGIDNTITTRVEEELWTLSKERFDLTDDFTHNGRLFQLILSHLEATSFARATRFQAIHSFHRSMWASCFLSLFVVVIGFSLGYGGSTVIRSTSALVLVALASIIGIRIFGTRKEKFNRKFVEYAIVDFYVDQTAKSTER